MSVTQSFDNLFAPMDKKYCELFRIISMFAFFILVIAVFHFIFLFKDIKRNQHLIFSSFIAICSVGINYVYNRLLYNMCK